MVDDRIEVTDLFISFYEVAKKIWSEPDFRGQNLPSVLQIGDYWYNVESYLHEHLFLAGCARRVFRLTGKSCSIKEIHSSIRVCDMEGKIKEGDSGKYYGSGFDWGKPNDEGIPPLVISGDVRGEKIGEFLLFVVTNTDG